MYKFLTRETILQCQILFSGENKKNITKVSSPDFIQRMLNPLWTEQILPCYILEDSEMGKPFAKSGDPDQTLHSALSYLGLHCLSITLLVVSTH